MKITVCVNELREAKSLQMVPVSDCLLRMDVMHRQTPTF